METNNCKAFYLHSLLWLDGNLALANLVKDIANPDNEEYRLKVKSFVKDMFTITLNKSLVKEAFNSNKRATVIKLELIHNRL